MMEGIKSSLSGKKPQSLACFIFRVKEQQLHVFFFFNESKYLKPLGDLEPARRKRYISSWLLEEGRRQERSTVLLLAPQ